MATSNENTERKREYYLEKVVTWHKRKINRYTTEKRREKTGKTA